MTLRILEYDNGHIKITENAFAIPELKAIIDRYELHAEPYLMFVHLMTALDSPHRNLEYEERKEVVAYDVINTLGDFELEDNLLYIAIDKLTKLYTTPLMSFFEEIEEELHRMRNYLRANEITGGKDGDLADRFRILKEAGAIAGSYKKAQTAAIEEVAAKGRGKAKIGDY